MFNFRDKKSRTYLFGMLISVAVLLIVFYSTDGLLGDKEFSEYTSEDWSVAILPLAIMVVSAISTLVFALIIIIPIIWMYPALMDYMINRKFSDVDSGTEFFAFDHNELKRACCCADTENGVFISVKEYDLKTRKWITLEENRFLENADNLTLILKKDYNYDRVKFYPVQYPFQ